MAKSMTKKILLFWSGGIESALCLHYLKQNSNYEIAGLVTIFNRETSRVPFHGIPDSLIIEQAKLLNLPLQRIFIPDGADTLEYKSHVQKILSLFLKKGITSVAFGDIAHLETKEFFLFGKKNQTN
jgi:diphthamide synthase (EF-2-diphthine--ammonia ligase)